MKISKRGEYALRALIDLGIAKELGRGLVQITELAAQERLSIKFLEQILTQLKEAGYVESKRGRYGVYSLKMPGRPHPLWQRHPVHRRPARPHRLRQPDGLQTMHLPGRRSLRPAHAHARCAQHHSEYP